MFVQARWPKSVARRCSRVAHRMSNLRYSFDLHSRCESKAFSKVEGLTDGIDRTAGHPLHLEQCLPFIGGASAQDTGKQSA